MSATFTVGKDCDSWCTRCRMDLAHTIVAMVSRLPVQVICNTCGGKHRYRPPKSGSGSSPRRPPLSPASARRSSGVSRLSSRVTNAAREAAAAEQTLRQRWHELVDEHGAQDPQAYDVRGSLAPGEVLKHKQFGIGFVVEEQSFNRVKVLFRDAERTLVVNHGKQPAT